MATLNRWRSPIHVEPTSYHLRYDVAAMTVTIRVTPRRWHPAWWRVGLRMIEPRHWWRPSVWAALYRATRTMSRG